MWPPHRVEIIRLSSEAGASHHEYGMLLKDEDFWFACDGELVLVFQVLESKRAGKLVTEIACSKRAHIFFPPGTPPLLPAPPLSYARTCILYTQADTMLCSGADMRLEDFLDYDYVGAPFRPVCMCSRVHAPMSTCSCMLACVHVYVGMLASPSFCRLCPLC